MENDSPNLFDTEPVSVKLTTVPENADDILTEIIDEIHGAGPTNDEVGAVDDLENVDEYHTDESDDENNEDGDGDDTIADQQFDADESTNQLLDANESTDQPLDADESVDQSAEGQVEDSPHNKKKDVHKGLPPGRVKLIMKMDPDVNIVAADAVYILTKATESFVGLLAQHCHKVLVASNKKTLKKKHIDAVIEENVPFEFLEGTLDW